MNSLCAKVSTAVIQATIALSALVFCKAPECSAQERGSGTIQATATVLPPGPSFTVTGRVQEAAGQAFSSLVAPRLLNESLTVVRAWRRSDQPEVVVRVEFAAN